VIPVLAVATRPGPGLRSLFKHLSGSGIFELKVAGPEALVALNGTRVVLGASDRRLRPDQAEALAGWLRGGGALVTLGGTAAAWAENPELDGLLGTPPSEPSPEAELLVRPVPGHPITDRLEPEMPITDRLPLGGRADGQPLLTAPWHYEDVVLAYERGSFVNLGLGWTDAALGCRAMQQLTHRALRHAAGEAPARPVRIGMIGFGAIGREHAEAASSVSGVQLVAVCDRAQPRLDAAKAEFDARGYLEPDQLLADSDVDLVVVGTPPATHAEVVLQALAAGKHVVCEKPFALRVDEVDAMLAAAASNDRVITVYQSRRWDPDFVAVRSAVRQGAIGDLFYLESFIGGFGHPCSYWHSHEPISGGTIYDWGSHYFDWMLQLIEGPVASVSAVAHKRVWHDVTNADHSRVGIRFVDGVEADFIHSDLAAAMKPKWYVLGTAGAIVGQWRHERVIARNNVGNLVEDPLAASESPAVLSLHASDGSVTAVRSVTPPPEPFHRELADRLLTGAPMSVTPQGSRRNIAVMEAATISAREGGRPVTPL